MTTNNEHRAKMAELVKAAGSALYKVALYWEENDLPGNFSTPETGYPFQLSLDDVCANVWGWAEALEGPQPEPTAQQLDTWAHDIMRAVVDDIAEHRIPLGVRTFSELHNYVDANEYLLATSCPWGRDVATQADDCGVRYHNDLTERVEGLLVATADALAIDLKGKCTNAKHEHTDDCDPQGLPFNGYRVPMVCYHCQLPAHWDEQLGWYQHDEIGKPCWRLDDDDNRTPCEPNDVIDLDQLVDVLQRLGLHAMTEMTGGGVATVYAGKVVGADPDLCDAPLYEACAGPGWFEGPYYSQPRATLNEFYVDRGPQDVSGPDIMWTGFLHVVQEIMKLCK